jgi:hypothetical protein
MTMDTSLLGLLSLVIMGWIRDLRERIAGLTIELAASRAETATATKLYADLRDVYNLVVGQYRELARRVKNADPLPYSPESGDRDGESAS